MKNWVTFVATHSGLSLFLVGALSLLSLFFIKDLNIEAFPDPSPPIIEVVTLFEGKPTEEIERRITIPEASPFLVEIFSMTLTPPSLLSHQ